MLKTLDILIGAITVLLLFSMVVTVVTQAITSFFQSKGKHLKAGLANLLQQLGISDIKMAQAIADKVLTHPMIASAEGKLGTVIHREEFTRLLLGLGSGQGAATLEDGAKNALLTTLQSNGISDPAEALKNIRDMSLRLEASNPEIASHVREGLAVLHGAPSDFVARVNSWFDQSMDRVGERFTQYTQWVVVAVSAVVVLVVQLDMIAVVNRLSIDDQFRNSVVSAAVKDFSKQVTPPSTETASSDKTSGSAQDGKKSTTGQQTNTETASSDKTRGSAQDGKKSTTDQQTNTDSQSQTAPPAPDNPKQPPDDLQGRLEACLTADVEDAGKKAANDARVEAKKSGKTDAEADTAAKAEEEKAKSDAEKANKAAARTPECQSINPRPYYDLLNKAGLLTLPFGGGNWCGQLLDMRKWPGMFISVLLLSLGAPFWYNALKDLLKLRSAIAGKDDSQRAERQGVQSQSDRPSTQGPSGGPAADGPGLAPAVLKGESGDLGAVG